MTEATRCIDIKIDFSFPNDFFFSFFARHLSMGLARHEVDNLNLHVGLDRPSLHIKMPIVATEKKRSILF